MESYKRHKLLWDLLCPLVSIPIIRKFNFDGELVETEGPCIVIPNHVSNWDPLLLAASFRKKHIYFVASEHIFRWGLLSKIINWLVAPIARRKASVASDTIRSMLRHVKAGHSICIFGEGEGTWTGVSNKVVPATGKMVRTSGATLITYKLEGAYLTDPRWGKKLRRGRIRGRVVNTYSPQQLKAMSPEEINETINRDIYEDAWARQREEGISYKGKDLALGMERGLFLCPRCRRMDGLKGKGNKISCSCGFELEFLPTGFFSPAEPFETIAQWDKWQHEALKNGDFVKGEDELFGDDEISLFSDSREESRFICKGRLRQQEDRLEIGEVSLLLDDITHMDMVNTHKLFVKTEEDYYELRSDSGSCLRKYLAVWRNRKEKAE